jgi:hypothetical protein
MCDIDTVPIRAKDKLVVIHALFSLHAKIKRSTGCTGLNTARFPLLAR